jgi:hypothetical protein
MPGLRSIFFELIAMAGGGHEGLFERGVSPEVIEIMTAAFDAAVATLPEPVHLAHITIIAESILRTADAGERDAAILERIALMELSLAQRP